MKPFEKVLKLGDEGPLVEDLQERLISLGFKTCFLPDESIGVLDEPTGHFGEVTQELVQSFQSKTIAIITTKMIDIPKDIELKVTGEMDLYTHWLLNNYEKVAEYYKQELEPEEIEIPKEEEKEIPQEKEPVLKTSELLIKKIIELAKSQLGVTEKGGNNYGKQVEDYQRIGSKGAADGGQPWCQYFMNWLLIMACKSLKIEFRGTFSGYTPFWVNWGKQKKITLINPKISEVEIGDLMYVYSSARNNACHVALVIGKEGNNVITIEGNTNPGGGSDGFGVFKRKRPCPWAVVKWHKLY